MSTILKTGDDLTPTEFRGSKFPYRFDLPGGMHQTVTRQRVLNQFCTHALRPSGEPVSLSGLTLSERLSLVNEGSAFYGGA